MIDAAPVMLKLEPDMIDSELVKMPHRQMDGWLPLSTDAGREIKKAIKEARASLEASKPGTVGDRPDRT